MGRNVKPRINYDDDANYLARLIKAVEMDSTVSPVWKKDVITSLNTVRSRFLQHASAKAAQLSKT